jgi:hypothetical protein
LQHWDWYIPHKGSSCYLEKQLSLGNETSGNALRTRPKAKFSPVRGISVKINYETEVKLEKEM